MKTKTAVGTEKKINLGKKCIKAVAAFLSLSLALTPGVSFANRGAQAVYVQNGFVPEFSGSLPLALKTANLREALSGLGTVEEVHFSENEESPSIYLVQDAHSSLEAQKNISKILSLLNNREEAQEIFLEGAIDTADPELLRFFKEESRNHQLAQLFLKNGLIGGTELFLLEHSRTALPVEDASLYSKSLELYRSVLRRDNRTRHYLSSLKVNISSVNAGVFNKELAGYFKEWLFYEMGEARPIHRIESLAKYARQVLGVDLNKDRSQEAWPQLTRILKIKSVEKELNPGAAKIEKEKAAAWAKKHGFPEGMVASLKLAGEAPAENAGADVRKAAEIFYDAAHKAGFAYSDYPAFSKSLAFEILRSELDGLRLFAEMDRMNDLILERLTKEKNEKELIGVYRDYSLMKKLMTLSATDEDFERVMKSKKAVSPEKLAARILKIAAKSKNSGSVKKIIGKENRLAESIYADALKFYGLAKTREGKIFKNMMSRLAGSGKKSAVLVSGGFHTSGLKKMMRENSLTYAVITPRILEVPDDSAYQSVMALRGDYDVKQSYIKQATAANPLFKIAETLGRPVAEHYAGMMNAGIATLADGQSLEELVAEINQSPAGQRHLNRNKFYELTRPDLAVMNELFVFGITGKGPVVRGAEGFVQTRTGDLRSEIREVKETGRAQTEEVVMAREGFRARAVKKMAAVSMSVLTLLNVVTPAAKTTLIAGGIAVCGQGCGILSQSQFNQLDLHYHIRTVLLAGQDIASIERIPTNNRDLVAAQVRVGESTDATYLTVVYSTKRDKDGNPVEMLSIAGDIRSLPRISSFDDTGHIFIYRSHDSYQDLNASTADKVAIYGFRDNAASANGVVNLNIPPDADLKIQDYRGGRLSVSFYPNVGVSAGGTMMELNASARGVVSVVSVNYHYLPAEIIPTLPHAASNPSFVFEERGLDTSLTRGVITHVFTTEGELVTSITTTDTRVDGSSALTTIGDLNVSPDGNYLIHAYNFRSTPRGSSQRLELQKIKIYNLNTGESYTANVPSFYRPITSVEFIEGGIAVHFENGWETHYNFFGDEIALVEVEIDRSLTPADITTLPTDTWNPQAVTVEGETIEPVVTDYGVQAQIAHDATVGMEGFGLQARTWFDLMNSLNEREELVFNLKIAEGQTIPANTQLTLEFGARGRHVRPDGVSEVHKKSMDIPMPQLRAGDNLINISRAKIEEALTDQGLPAREVASIYLMAWHENGTRRVPVSFDSEFQVVAHTEIPANAIPSPDGQHYLVVHANRISILDNRGATVARVDIESSLNITLVEFLGDNEFAVHYRDGHETHYNIYGDEIALVTLRIDRDYTTDDITTLSLENLEPRAITENGKPLEHELTNYGLQNQIQHDGSVNMEGFGFHARTPINLYDHLNERDELVFNVRIPEGQTLPANTQWVLEFDSADQDINGDWHTRKKAMDIPQELRTGDNLVVITREDIEKALAAQGVNPEAIIDFFLILWHENGTERVPVSVDVELQVVSTSAIPAGYGYERIQDIGDSYQVIMEDGRVLTPADAVSQGTIHVEVGPGGQVVPVPVYPELLPHAIQNGETAVFRNVLMNIFYTTREPMATIPAFVIINGNPVAVTVTRTGTDGLGHPAYSVSFPVEGLRNDGSDVIEVLSVYEGELIRRVYHLSANTIEWSGDVTSNPSTPVLSPDGSRQVINLGGYLSVLDQNGNLLGSVRVAVDNYSLIMNAGNPVMTVSNDGIYYATTRTTSQRFWFAGFENLSEPLELFLPEGIIPNSAGSISFPVAGEPIVDIVATDGQTYRVNLESGEFVEPAIHAAYGNERIQDIGDSYQVIMEDGRVLTPADAVSQGTIEVEVGPGGQVVPVPVYPELLPHAIQNGETAVFRNVLMNIFYTTQEPMATVPAFVVINGNPVAVTVTSGAGDGLGHPGYFVSFHVEGLRNDGSDVIEVLSVYEGELIRRVYHLSANTLEWSGDVTSSPSTPVLSPDGEHQVVDLGGYLSVLDQNGNLLGSVRVAVDNFSLITYAGNPVMTVSHEGIYYATTRTRDQRFWFAGFDNLSEPQELFLPEGIIPNSAGSISFPVAGEPIVEIYAADGQTYRINLETGAVIDRYSIAYEQGYLVVRDSSGEEIGSVQVNGLRSFAIGISAIYYVVESGNNYTLYTNSIDPAAGLGKTESIRLDRYGLHDAILFANQEIPVIRYRGTDRVLRFVNLDTNESVVPTTPNGVYSVANLYGAPGHTLVISQDGTEIGRVSLANSVGNYMVTNEGIFAATNLPAELLFVPFDDLNQAQTIALPGGLLPVNGSSTEFPLAFVSPNEIAPIANVLVMVDGAYETYSFDLSTNPATLLDENSRSELRASHDYFADYGASIEAVVDTAKYAAAETVSEVHRKNEEIYQAILDAVAPEIVKEAAVPGLSDEAVRDLVNARISTLPRALAVQGLVMDGEGAAVLSTESRPEDVKKRTSLILAALPFLIKLAAKDSRGNFLPSFIFTGEKDKMDQLRGTVLGKKSGLTPVEANQAGHLIAFIAEDETARAVQNQIKRGKGVTLSLTSEELQKLPADVQNILNAIEDLSELEGAVDAEALVEKAEAYAVRAHLLTKLAALVHAELLKGSGDVPSLIRNFFAQNLPDIDVHLDGTSFRLSLSDVAAQLAIFRQAAEKMAASA